MDEQLKSAAAEHHSRILDAPAPLYGAKCYAHGWHPARVAHTAETARALAEHIATLYARVEALERKQ